MNWRRSAFEKKSGDCPRCARAVPPSKEIFRKEFRCAGCGVLLYIPVPYLRVLFLSSAAIGITVAALAVGVRNPVRPFVFGIPLGFVILMALVRVVPYFRLPVFLLRDPEDVTNITTLDLIARNTASESSENRREDSD